MVGNWVYENGGCSELGVTKLVHEETNGGFVRFLRGHIREHLVHGTVSNPTDGVTHSVCEEENALCWTYLASSLEIFHLSSIGFALEASDLQLHQQLHHQYPEVHWALCIDII
ncbi:putative N-acetyltransferase HLS1 [Senna tora]|uniref:Putative N-acetyltransferase HLS1 n=1 Tax=Senna tora TaxID=362788 RepID=A0A834WX49_9FABA|nr:putative N-acetyltransferase HLS1 [Senna tora]